MNIKNAFEAYLQLIGMAIPSARTTTDRTRHLREFLRWKIRGDKLCDLDASPTQHPRPTLSSIPETTTDEVAKVMARMRGRSGVDLIERVKLLRADPSKLNCDDALSLMRRWRDDVMLRDRGRKAAQARWSRKSKPSGSKKVLGARKNPKN